MSEAEYIKALEGKGLSAARAVKFLQYHKKHPEIWKHFEALTLRVISNGKKTNAMSVLNRIRWDIEIESTGNETFKVNHNLAPEYARMFEIKYPQHSNFFEKNRLFARAKKN